MNAHAAHAFKEWSAIVNALGSGAQTIILRKGGISEGRGGFDPTRAGRFWLFPTLFHAQREKLKAAAAPCLDLDERHSAAVDPSAPPSLRFYADLVAHRFLSDWTDVAALDTFHLWTEATIRERFDWAKPAGLHLLLVRVYRLDSSLALPAGLDLGGCKSWIEVPLPCPPTGSTSTPALNDSAFAAARAALPLALQGDTTTR